MNDVIPSLTSSSAWFTIQDPLPLMAGVFTGLLARADGNIFLVVLVGSTVFGTLAFDSSTHHHQI